jgi:hypothetical protein
MIPPSARQDHGERRVNVVDLIDGVNPIQRRKKSYKSAEPCRKVAAAAATPLALAPSNMA